MSHPITRVRDLIEELQTLDPDVDVVVRGTDFERSSEVQVQRLDLYGGVVAIVIDTRVVRGDR